MKCQNKKELKKLHISKIFKFNFYFLAPEKASNPIKNFKTWRRFGKSEVKLFSIK